MCAFMLACGYCAHLSVQNQMVLLFNFVDDFYVHKVLYVWDACELNSVGI